ncbi:MAG: ATP-binding protein [Oscillochloridaceae bacterium umkhey_bin13]
MTDAPQKILYVEDNHDNQRLVQRVLGGRGYQVLIAEDGTSGVALAREHTPVLILVDLNVPGLDGYEATTRLRSLPHLTGVPIVALTADDSPGARERALVAGCDGFLSKPIEPRQLPGQVAEFIAGRRDQVTTPNEEIELLRAYSQKLVERLEQRILDLNVANAELQELDRLKGRFLATLSHELRTPLTSLVGYIELFERGMLGTLTPTQSEALGVMKRSSYILTQQLNSLLYFQELRERSLTPRLIQPFDVLTPLLVMLADQARDLGVILDAKGDKAAPLVIDPSGFEQLVRALIDNALKFTPKGGRVRVLFHDEPSRLIIRVEDNGPGIAPEHHQKIFLPFFRIESDATVSKTGAGLGLAIARHIAEVHGGQITVRSTFGQGSSFTVVLPRAG